MASKRGIKRRLRQKKCTGKKRYSDQTGAVFAMIRYKRAFPKSANVSSYKCEFCGFFHFGHYNPNR